MDIDNSLYDVTMRKSSFYRDLQIWPLNDVLNYKGWLDNFTDLEERKIACHILDFFIFYPKEMLNQMLNAVIGHVGYVFASHFSDWQHDDFRNRCFYSFIPGETINPTDSGHIYVRKLRNSLGIPEDKIVDNTQLYAVLEKNTNLPIIFVDDFVGSGAQCDKAWNNNRGGSKNYTLNEIASSFGHKFVYAPLVANQTGYDRIRKECQGLTLVTNHILLNDEYNLFKPTCICWKGDNDLYNKGTQLIIEKSRDLGIPFTDGNNVIDVKGFGEQGLALAFDDDGVPDAIPAIFYWCSDNWTPLIKKEYQR
jgi:hypothetical protein